MKLAGVTTPRHKEILEKSVLILRNELNPEKIILFGSRAKGNAKESADFDFAVDCNLPKREKQRQVQEMIEAVAGLYQVDIVYLQDVEKKFKELVIKTGKIIYER